MKKLLGIIGLSVALLSGCGDSEDPNQNQNNNSGHENTNADSNTDQSQINCPTGFTGPNCDQCAEGYTGSNCVKISCINGTLDTQAGTCTTCNQGWAGDNCDQCAEGFTGSNCVKISCVNGKLDTEAGSCESCNQGWTGNNCDQCSEGLAGENCDHCEDGFTSTFETSDGNTYKTVCINSQTWMAENLRNSDVEHYSADGNSDNDDQYGYLYSWENAMKACPSGWRLPTKNEFLDLIGSSDADKVTFTTILQDSSWNSDASNSTGFSALPAGFYHADYFYYFGLITGFWSSTTNDSNQALTLRVDKSCVYMNEDSFDYAFSVRCIKD